LSNASRASGLIPEVIELDGDDDDDEQVVADEHPLVAASSSSSSSGAAAASRAVIDLVSDDSGISSGDESQHPSQSRAFRVSDFVQRRLQERRQRSEAFPSRAENFNARMEQFRQMRDQFDRRTRQHLRETFHRRTEEHLRQARERLRAAQALIEEIQERGERRRAELARELGGRTRTEGGTGGVERFLPSTYAEARAQLLATLGRMQSFNFGVPRRVTPDAVIAAIPTHIVPAFGVASASSSSSTDDEECCVICLDGFEPGQSVSTLKCNHRYHTTCINKWLKEDTVCCTCRQDVTL